ncbi:MAG: hypothetical protein M1405_02680 [Patescibacteria group bacterium]|nr:hypothetical protein [Patescibacteria group bacterium]
MSISLLTPKQAGDCLVNKRLRHPPEMAVFCVPLTIKIAHNPPIIALCLPAFGGSRSRNLLRRKERLGGYV